MSRRDGLPPGLAPGPGRAGLVVYRKAVGADAIDEYTRRLVAALGDLGVPARYGADGLASARREHPRPGWILIQYNPFAYGRWGVAPGLVVEALRFRRAARVPLVVSVHEAWVGPGDRGRAPWRSALMGSYQHAQLAALLRVADVVLAATEALVRKVGHDAVHVPVASNITPVEITRLDARGRLRLSRDAIVICLFGTGHPSRALEFAAAAIERIAAERGPAAIKVLNLGLGAPELGLRPEIAVETPGHLDGDELSVRLHAADVLLLPFTDGLSTRRTTLMAGLAHGLPVVGLYGPETDKVLTGNPRALTLTPVGDIDAFARATLALLDDPGRLRTTAEAGRALYASRFDWPITARRVAAALNADPPRR